MMNEKQLEAFNIVKNNENLFLSGSAGTGKSFTIKNIVEYLEENKLKEINADLAEYKKGNKSSFMSLENAKQECFN